MANPMEKNLEHSMEIGLTQGFTWINAPYSYGPAFLA